MQSYEGFRQRRLRKIHSRWGSHQRRHSVLVPFFGDNFQVMGFVGLTSRVEPTWYPAVPMVSRHGSGLVFKNTLMEEPPALADADPTTFSGAYYFDPAQELRQLAHIDTRYPSFTDAVNLADFLLQGRPVVDVVLEATLHRVRGFLLRRTFLGARFVSIMRVPLLRNALQPTRRQRRRKAVETPHTLREQMEAQARDVEV